MVFFRIQENEKGAFFPIRGIKSVKKRLSRAGADRILCPPQIIKTESAFVGYNILLEYLWKAMEEPEEIEDIHSFCKKRYRYRKNIYEKIDEVCLLISHENRPMFNDEQNYKEICQEMARALNEDVAVA